MMQKNDYLSWFITMVMLAALGTSCATTAAGEQTDAVGSSYALIILHPVDGIPDRFARERSDCQRYGVIWSGGVALRRPDRISPRPVRSRWQGRGGSRIRCTDGDAFRQQRVASQPWVH